LADLAAFGGDEINTPLADCIYLRKAAGRRETGKNLSYVYNIAL
jgi:hypothetical protein